MPVLFPIGEIPHRRDPYLKIRPVYRRPTFNTAIKYRGISDSIHRDLLVFRGVECQFIKVRSKVVLASIAVYLDIVMYEVLVDCSAKCAWLQPEIRFVGFWTAARLSFL